MSIDAYLNPDFGLIDKLIFFLASLAGMVICIAVILLATRLTAGDIRDRRKHIAFYRKAHNRVDLFYEFIIAGVSVMSFSCAYVIINHICTLYAGGVGTGSRLLSFFVSFWDKWRDFLLLLLICMSCVLNTLLDRLLVPLKHIKNDEKASIRMLGMFYIILILIYLNRVGDESEYSPVMLYYLGLMVGRFIYFDASFADFIQALKNLFKNLPFMILGVLLNGVLCAFGFRAGYFLERNYIIMGVFYTHLFLLVCAFLLRHSHILSLIVRKPEGLSDDDQEDEDDNSYDDDYYDDDHEPDSRYADDVGDDYSDGGYGSDYDGYDPYFDDDGYERDEFSDESIDE